MYLKVNDITLYYQKKGKGPALIMLHGNGEDHRIFDKSVKILKQYFTVYTIDTRGHGRSSKVTEYHYKDMADDVYEFIQKLKLEKPILYGFSDGGIVGLLLAYEYPNLLSKLVISGANTRPSGMKCGWLWLFRLMYLFKPTPEFKLMLTEPHITNEMLHSIKIPVYMTVGSKDMISVRDTKRIYKNIPKSKLKIFHGENHGSYIINSEKIGRFLERVLERV